MLLKTPHGRSAREAGTAALWSDSSAWRAWSLGSEVTLFETLSLTQPLSPAHSKQPTVEDYMGMIKRSPSPPEACRSQLLPDWWAQQPSAGEATALAPRQAELGRWGVGSAPIWVRQEVAELRDVKIRSCGFPPAGQSPGAPAPGGRYSTPARPAQAPGGQTSRSLLHSYAPPWAWHLLPHTKHPVGELGPGTGRVYAWDLLGSCRVYPSLGLLVCERRTLGSALRAHEG